MLRPRLVIIIPSWLKVDKAIIFFISHSVIALSPAITMVVTATIRRKILNIGNVCRKV